ncbi:Starch-binding associating with outer membrane [Catalinimonas alkaloidigena]|uniref:Starch-binding associating with outer membrane n=1 Tax=Catalinimonas alkaloidigena TaxID=1075417 RepID=A0A1G9TMM0_9BACT|nr:RagB/SusD family nutrient uptake outer membrane protein [Catalinimonas alkaloidigena]SDM48892.1 Starch-binding associating with outer membrane [Catalinimonas alkaloidigena]
MQSRRLYLLLIFALLSTRCADVLDLQPLDRITADDLFGDPEGTKLYMANLYYQLPIEDFTFFPKNGFNYNVGDPNNGGFVSAMLTDEAVHSERADFLANEDLRWWDTQDGKDQGYRVIRDVNLLFEVIPTLDITDEERDAYLGEASFLRAFCYFALVKRYGGVPLITTQQTFEGDVEALKVPRSTEQATWDFVLAECDVAIAKLGEDLNPRRATKWTAYALKSRVALHAASIAKFGSRAPLSGTAVEQGLIGLNESLAAGYYQASLDASRALMESGRFSLYGATPATPDEAGENYRLMFEDPNRVVGTEAIFIKGRTLVGNDYGHNYDIWFQPAQVANGWPHPGRMNPTLDLVDAYERYDTPGQSAPIVTTEDGNTADYGGFDASRTYLTFDDPQAIFEGKDARLKATVVLPGSTWKGLDIIIQAGYVAPDGTARLLSRAKTDVNGVTYYTYGGATPNLYSGFDPYGGNNTKTGFSFKKFMTTNPIVPGWNQSTTDWLEFRYAEILLNYAEAVVESGLGDAAIARDALNAVRRRAGHTTAIELTSANVMRERTVELAFENKRLWDLMRRREYHLEFNNRMKHALLPVLDLRTETPKYMFVRAQVANYVPQTFQNKDYYRPIQGIGGNGLVQNPQY